MDGGVFDERGAEDRERRDGGPYVSKGLQKRGEERIELTAFFVLVL